MRRPAAQIVKRLLKLEPAEFRTCRTSTAPFCLQAGLSADLGAVQCCNSTCKHLCSLCMKQALLRGRCNTYIYGEYVTPSDVFAGKSVQRSFNGDRTSAFGRVESLSTKNAPFYAPLRWQSSQAELAGGVRYFSRGFDICDRAFLQGTPQFRSSPVAVHLWHEELYSGRSTT